MRRLRVGGGAGGALIEVATGIDTRFGTTVSAPGAHARGVDGRLDADAHAARGNRRARARSCRATISRRRRWARRRPASWPVRRRCWSRSTRATASRRYRIDISADGKPQPATVALPWLDAARAGGGDPTIGLRCRLYRRGRGRDQRGGARGDRADHRYAAADREGHRLRSAAPGCGRDDGAVLIAADAPAAKPAVVASNGPVTAQAAGSVAPREIQVRVIGIKGPGRRTILQGPGGAAGRHTARSRATTTASSASRSLSSSSGVYIAQLRCDEASSSHALIDTSPATGLARTRTTPAPCRCPRCCRRSSPPRRCRNRRCCCRRFRPSRRVLRFRPNRPSRRCRRVNRPRRRHRCPRCRRCRRSASSTAGTRTRSRPSASSRRSGRSAYRTRRRCRCRAATHPGSPIGAAPPALPVVPLRRRRSCPSHCRPCRMSPRLCRARATAQPGLERVRALVTLREPASDHTTHSTIVLRTPKVIADLHPTAELALGCATHARQRNCCCARCVAHMPGFEPQMGRLAGRRAAVRTTDFTRQGPSAAIPGSSPRAAPRRRARADPQGRARLGPDARRARVTARRAPALRLFGRKPRHVRGLEHLAHAASAALSAATATPFRRKS